MRTLFVYPEFPKTFWSYEKILELVNRKVFATSPWARNRCRFATSTLADEAGGSQR